ncbi:MAG: hypothetical protein IJ190_14370 [Prevotella sp.]|nr:hypothetical protein [Prevotella sp.]
MVQWLNRITMSDAAAKLTQSSEGLSQEVDFTWINTKTGKETTKRFFLIDAILLAERRREDGHYKNYEFQLGSQVKGLVQGSTPCYLQIIVSLKYLSV